MDARSLKGTVGEHLETGPGLIAVLFDSNPLSLAMFSGESMAFFAVNDATLSAYRYTRDAFLRLTALTLLPVAERAAFLAWHAGNVHPPVHRRATGTWHHLRGDGSLMEVEFEESGRFVYQGLPAYLMTFFDVAERNRATELMHATSVALKTAVDVAGIGTFSLDLRTGEQLDASQSVPLMTRPDEAGSEQHSQRHDAPRSIAEQQPFETEYVEAVNGAMRWFHSGAQLAYDDDGVATHIVGVTADVTERRSVANQLLALAYRDDETGLVNRAAMLNDGVTLNDATTGVVLLHTDMVAGFSGRDRGLRMRVAQDAARVIAASVPSDATVIRYADEVFAVVTGATGRNRSIVALAKKLLTCFEHPLRIGEDEAVIVPAIGVAATRGRRRDALILCREAECALDVARHSETHFAVYDENLGASADRRVTIQKHLRRAIAQRRVGVEYQPIVSLASGRIVGAEALMRWECPGLGDVPPTEFIEIAEQTGEINKLGEWILREACAQARRWQLAAHTLRMAVNVSARQIKERDFLRVVSAACEAASFNPELLELEVTERVMTPQDGMVLRNMQALRRLGARISIDDFGTGYSSLSYLKSLPLDTLKIDRSFVTTSVGDAFQAEVTRSVIALARLRGLYVVGEGVETVEQLEMLRAMGCDEVQGFLLSPPLGEADFLVCLREKRIESLAGRGPSALSA